MISPMKRSTISDVLQREVGARLQAARQAKGYKQARLAADLGLSRTTVSNIERGKQRLFLDQIYEAAFYLGVGIEALLPPLQDLAPTPAVRMTAEKGLPAGTQKRLTRAVHTVMEQIATSPQGRGDTHETGRAPRPVARRSEQGRA